MAWALPHDPTLILADEPTGNLDLKTGREIIDLLKQLNETRGVTIISNTHDHKMVSVSDRIVRLQDGQIERIEDTSDLDITLGSIDGETE